MKHGAFRRLHTPYDYLDHNQPMPFLLLADAASSTALEQFVQHCLIGLTTRSLIVVYIPRVDLDEPATFR